MARSVTVASAGRPVSAATPASGGSGVYGGHTGTGTPGVNIEPGGRSGLRVSVRSFGNDVIPDADPALMSTIIAAGCSVYKQMSPLSSASTIRRLDATADTCPSKLR